MLNNGFVPTLEVDDKLISVPKWIKALFLLYIFLSYFEAYLVSFIGNSTKFVMLAIIGILLLTHYKNLKVTKITGAFILWFVYLCVSLLWSNMTNPSFKMHSVALLGSVLLVFVLGGMNFDEDFIRLNLRGHYWISFIFGLLSIFFNEHYHEDIEARNVLTLFGEQSDPNNCAAFLLIGLSLALYSVIYENEKIWLNLVVIIVNGYAILLTASRAGFLGLGIMIALFVIFYSQLKKTNIYESSKKIMFILLSVCSMGYIGLKFLPRMSLDRLILFEEYSGGSGRTEKWYYALELIKQRPFFGWGWGGYEYINWGGIHNTFLSICCDSGIFGSLIFTFPLILMCGRAIKSKNVLVVGLLICGLLPSFFIDAINKRFLWNAIIMSTMLMNYHSDAGGKSVKIWGTTNEIT